MKKLSGLIVLFTVGLFTANSQISIIEGPLEVGPGLGYNHPQIEMLGDGNPGVIWTSGGLYNLYFAKYDGAGGFTAPIQLNPTGTQALTYNWSGPDIAIEGSNVYVAYKENDYELGNIYLVKSTDNGATWSDTTRIDNLATDFGVYPDLAVLNDTVYVTFMQEDAGSTNPQYVMARSTDGGLTFEAEVDVTASFPDEVCECCQPEIIVNDDYVIVFFRYNVSNVRDIKAVVSSDRGITFTDWLDIDTHGWSITACPSTGPDAHFLNNETVLTAYRSKDGSDYKVYLNEFEVNSVTNVNTIEVSAGSGSGNGINYPQLSIDNGDIAIVWEEIDQSGDVWVNASSSGLAGIDSANALNVSNAGGTQSKPDVVLKDDVIHMVYADATSPTGVKYVKIISSLIGMDEEEKAVIKLYPNPSNGLIRIESESNSRQEIIVTNTCGAVVEKIISDSNALLDLSFLEAGTYFLRTTELSSGLSRVLPLVIEH